MKSNKDNQRFHQTNKFLQTEHIYPLLQSSGKVIRISKRYKIAEMANSFQSAVISF